MIKNIVFISGAAGFIGFHLAKRLLNEGIDVIGFDNLNNYYDKELKLARASELKIKSQQSGVFFNLIQSDLENYSTLEKVFNGENLNGEKIPIPNIVVNLAAQAGVRYSIENPHAYVQSNLLGFANILEICRWRKIKHLVYASSSSVYGGNSKLPFSEEDSVDHPISLYAATKKSNELMAHSYSHLYKLPATGLRFFTVYGPWGRPDMALFLFTKAILENRPINIFNNGNMMRDFTYIDDIVESLYRVIAKPADKDIDFNSLQPNPASSWAPHRVFNIGNSKPTPLLDCISILEKFLGIEAKKNFLPMQKGDVKATYADTTLLQNWINYKPNTSLKVGIAKFVEWYKTYYSI